MAGRARLRLFVHLCLIVAILAGCHWEPQTYETTVTAAEGGQLVFEDFRIAVPPGALPTDTRVAVRRVDNPPPLISQEMLDAGAKPTDVVMLTDVYDIDIGGATLAKPAVITVRYDPASIPRGFEPGDLKIAQYRDGQWYLLATEFNPDTHTLQAETDHFSLIAVVATGGWIFLGVSVAALGYVWYQKAALTNPETLEPDKVDLTGFEVDLANRRLLLNKRLVVRDRGPLALPKRASEMQNEENPTGMCIDFARLFGSLLIKAGYPVRIVSGTATYEKKNGSREKGGHQWVETVINGEPYYVDTYRADKSVDLVPLAEADARFHLDKGKVFWKEEQDGHYVAHTEEKYNPDWWKPYASSALPPAKEPTPVSVPAFRVYPCTLYTEDGHMTARFEFVLLPEAKAVEALAEYTGRPLTAEEISQAKDRYFIWLFSNWDDLLKAIPQDLLPQVESGELMVLIHGNYYEYDYSGKLLSIAVFDRGIWVSEEKIEESIPQGVNPLGNMDE